MGQKKDTEKPASERRDDHLALSRQRPPCCNSTARETGKPRLDSWAYWPSNTQTRIVVPDAIFRYVVGGPAVPPDQMSPRTRGPRTSCPPGHLVLGLDVPHQDGLSPRTSCNGVSTWKCLCHHGEMELEYDHLYNLCSFQSLSNQFF